MRADVNNIGSQYPFYSEKEDAISFNQEDFLHENNRLNSSSILSVLSTGYIVGNETMIEGIKRTPWLAGEKNLIDQQITPNFLELNEIVKKLEKLLIQEIREYIKGSSNIGILLSGGLDSRILAGLLRKIEIEEGSGFNKKVTVFNWGLETSRDVVYSKEIADRFNWNYKHFIINSERLKRNFFVNNQLGCEISPIHLHAMENVKNDSSVDVVLAGTYGDSLGRGNFSGIHVSNLTSHTHSINNKAGWIKSEYFSKYKKALNEKRYEFIKQNNIRTNVNEMDQYANYLRRMLATPMSIIQQRINVYQLFTSPRVYNFIINLPQKMRNDRVYIELLKSLPSEIGHIPYSKNGRNFTQKSSLTYDDFSSYSNHYGHWLRNDLQSFIKANYDMDLLYSLGIFNKGSLETGLKTWLRGKTLTNSIIDDRISYLTNLCIYIKEYNLEINNHSYRNDIIQDKLKHLRTYMYITLRNKLRD